MNRQTDRRIALLLVGLVLGLYARTLAPGLLAGDPGEFQFAAWRWGLAHPTGYPFYLLVGGLWQRLLALLGMGPAVALNAFSAVMGAATCGVLYLLLVYWLPGPVGRRPAALFAALLLALNPTFWSQSLIAEVYALHALFMVAILAVAGPLRPGGTAGRATADSRRKWLYLLFFLLGLALTHHRTSLFLLPGVIWLLFWCQRRSWQHLQSWWHPKRLIGLAATLFLPQLLYLYIPLRSGPAASPWLYQPLDGETLVLYANGWQGFLDFIMGRVFAVRFLGGAGALDRLAQTGDLWRLHFGWPGLLLVLLGLVYLFQRKQWPILILTLPYALIQQIFNLFYGIGDIFVFYIPLYVIGAIWAGAGVQYIIRHITVPKSADAQDGGNSSRAARRLLPLIAYGLLALFLLFMLIAYYPQVDRSADRSARQQWAPILAAQPPQDALLVSNDRNEIVPLYYLQAVEGAASGLTGLFPLITPAPRFADVAATTETALRAGGGRPVYLIKPMPGLAARFELQPARQPLVQVLGTVTASPSMQQVGRPFGPLTLLGYGWERRGEEVTVTLYWQVRASLPADYTTTVQFFAAGGEKVAQDDRSPGGVYYPTSLWKPGEILRDRHALALPAHTSPVRMLVGMYSQPDFAPLATPFSIELPAGLGG